MKQRLLILLTIITIAIPSLRAQNANDSLYCDLTYSNGICQNGHEGDKCIRLDSIPNYYLIEKINSTKTLNDSLAKRSNSYNILRPNESYTLSNTTIGDAAPSDIYFSTDSNAEIINVTTEEPLTDSPTE